MNRKPDLEAAVNNLAAATQQLLVAVKNLTGNNPSGRKPMSIPVTNICDALGKSQTIQQAADFLGVSKAYIYKYVPEPKKHLRLP